MEIERWSESLRVIKPKVERVLYKGNVDLLLDEAPKLAVVGSRRMSDYGQRVIEKWMPSFVQKGISIVSGFMYGVDQAAHKACIENGGKTIAVLGWGIDRKVVGEDEKLYQKILEVDSLIVSEYEGEQEAELWMFPQRNRIVAGIVDAVLVIEGAEKSGEPHYRPLGQPVWQAVVVCSRFDIFKGIGGDKSNNKKWEGGIGKKCGRSDDGDGVGCGADEDWI